MGLDFAHSLKFLTKTGATFAMEKCSVINF